MKHLYRKLRDLKKQIQGYPDEPNEHKRSYREGFLDGLTYVMQLMEDEFDIEEEDEDAEAA